MKFGNAFRKPFCVYAHKIDGTIIYIGSGTLARAFHLERTILWKRTVAGHKIDVEILRWFNDRLTAYHYEGLMIDHYRPLCNQTSPGGTPFQRYRAPAKAPRERICRAVRCVETEMIYPTSRAAHRAMGCSQPAFSAHLTGRAPSIRGFTFVRATAAEWAEWHKISR